MWLVVRAGYFLILLAIGEIVITFDVLDFIIFAPLVSILCALDMRMHKEHFLAANLGVSPLAVYGVFAVPTLIIELAFNLAVYGTRSCC